MLIKVKVRYPDGNKTTKKTVEMELKDGLACDEVIDWLVKNKRKVVKLAGCKLSNGELTKAINLGDVTIAPII